MKESAWDKQLWHDRMQQLPLEGDEHAMWQDMQSLLDKNMPAGTSGSGPAAPKNLPGAGTVISAIVVISATLALILYFLGVFHTGKQQRAENRVNKIKTDSMPANIQNPANITQQKSVAGKSAPTDSVSASKNTNGNTIKSSSTNGQGNTASAGKQHVPVTAGAANSNGANDKSAGNAANKQSNSINVLTNIPGKGRKSHSFVSGSQSSRKAYLQNAGMKHGGKPYFNQQNQQGATQLNTGTNNNSTGGNSTSNSNQNSTGNKADSSSLAQQKLQADTITSLLKTGQQIAQNGLTLSAKADSTNTTPAAGSAADKPTIQNNKSAKGQTAKGGSSKTKPGKKQTGNSRFEFDLRLGLNTGSGSSIYPGATAGYFFTPKVGVLIGADVMASRTFSGSYNSNTQLTYRVDTGKFGTRQSGQIIIGGSRKMYTVDVPVVVNYHINQHLSIYGGPVISIPVKANAVKPSLIKLANSNDTTRSLVAPYVSATTINTKLDYGITAGLRLHYNCWFISAGYVQDAQSYTISSGLGSGKINRYHTVQFGIGYQLFKPKNTKP